ncbi:MAG TPA: hypothetical protein VD902_22675 [Symbiobacteriaceae bacterium]|nr:hypothetical protein [Symbiobacteriaceae bacterium]
MVTLGLKILLALYILQALAKFTVHVFVKYETRKQRIEAMYKKEAVPLYDTVVLLLVLGFVVLLWASGKAESLSFTTGLVVGMTLIQTYFHRFTDPLPPERQPGPPVTPIKLMSFAIQANPLKAWREYLFMTVLLVGALYMLFIPA